MKLNFGVEDRLGVCPGGFLYGGTMGGAGDREGRPYEKILPCLKMILLPHPRQGTRALPYKIM